MIKGTSTVAVIHGDNILMGKRKDNDKWTFPGGGLNEDEHPHTGALRELFEEAGVRASKLDPIGSKVVEGRTGNKIHVHAFKLDLGQAVQTNSFNDPDNEVAKWEWIDKSNGLPAEIMDNLQSPKNYLLEQLNISSSKDVLKKELMRLK